MGDSGVPALLKDEVDYLLAGVHSSGTGDCSAGIDTRVDATSIG